MLKSISLSCTKLAGGRSSPILCVSTFSQVGNRGIWNHDSDYRVSGLLRVYGEV